jgi:RNA polymerase sigma factor (sigma-70 family)
MKRVARCLRRVALARDGGGLTDGQLLECFLATKEQAAFTALVRRHGPMVLGVCRRVLGDRQDAEDAFQATFLVLARKAAAIVRRDLLGSWLYGVAYRTALKARAAAGRRRAVERQVEHMPEPQERAEACGLDLRPVLDAELDRLPEMYRVPVVLCELEGKSKREVARALGVPEGTVSSRLARARKLLRARLARRGLALSAGALALALSAQALAAAVPAALVSSTSAAAAGGAGTAAVSARVAALAEGVLQTMFWTKLKFVAALLLLLAAAVAGVGVLPGPVPAASRASTPWAVPQQGDKGPGRKAPQWQEVASWTCDVPGAVAFSPDGKKLAAAGRSAVLLWDPATGKELASLPAEALDTEHGLLALAFSPDGKRVAAGGSDGSVTVWDLPTRKVTFAAGHGGAAVRSVAFSPDGKALASAGADKVARLWDLARRKERASLEGHAGKVIAVAFAPDGKTVATGSLDNTVKLWEAATGKERASREGQTARIGCLAFAPDGKMLASGGADGALKLWDPVTGKLRATLKAEKGRVDAVAFAPDGRTLAATGCEVNGQFTRVVGVVDPKGKVTKRTVKQVTAVVTLWDPATGKQRTTFRAEMGLPTGISFSPGGTRLALGGFAVRDDPVASNEGVVKVWELRPPPR